MRMNDIFEQTSVGSTPFPTPGNSTVPATGTPAAPPAQAGTPAQATQATQMSAAALAKQKQEAAARKKTITDQIAQLRKQMQDLQTELNTIK